MTSIRATSALVFATVAATLAILLIASSSSAQAATSLAIRVGSSSCVEINEGDTIEVELRIENITNLQTWEVTIVHDREILEITSQSAVQFLAQEPGSNVLANAEQLPDYNSRYLIGASDLSDASESGDGVLAIIEFRAIGAGTATIGIPQFDINNDGKVDEGARVKSYGSITIGDVNGDEYFDGPVQPARVAVDEDCNAQPTQKPTDPPTPAPGLTAPGGGGTDGTSPTPGSSPLPSGDQPSGSISPAPVGTPSPGNGENSPTPDSSSDPRDGTPREGTGPVGPVDSGSSSFPTWLIAALLAGGLSFGTAIVLLAMKRSSGTAL